MTARNIGMSATSGSARWHKNPEVRRLIRAQTGLNVALNAIMPTLLLWALGVPPPAHVTGLGGLLQALVVGVVVGTIVSFVSTTKAVRRKLIAGEVPPLRRSELHSVTRFLPAGDTGALFAILALALLLVIPAGVAIAVIAHRLPLGILGFAILNALIGVAVGLWVAPRVVLRTLASRP